MIGYIRKFANSLLAKVLLAGVVLSFVLFWGINDVIRRLTNSDYIVKVGNISIDNEEFNYKFQKISENFFKAFNDNVDRKKVTAMAVQYTIAMLINQSLLDLIVKHFGFSFDSEVVNFTLMNDPRFADSNGKFSRIKFEDFLKSERLNEEIFDENLANEAKRFVVKFPLDASYNVPDDLAKFLKLAEEEVRYVRIYTISSNDIHDLHMPSDSVLMEFYDKNKEKLFVIPEYRTVELFKFNESDIHSFVTDSEVKELYEKRKKEEGMDEPFNNVKEDLKKEIEQDKNYSILSEVTKEIEERVNAGKDCDDLLKKYKFIKYKKTQLNNKNLDKKGKVAFDEKFSDIISVMAFDSSVNDEISFTEAGNGDWFLVKIVDIEKAKIDDYKDVDKNKVYIEWNKYKKMRIAEKLSYEIERDINKGKKVVHSFKDLHPLIRQDIALVPSEINKEIFEKIFNMPIGKSFTIKHNDSFVVTLVLKRETPHSSKEDLDNYKNGLRDTLVEDLFNDLLVYFKSNNAIKVNTKSLRGISETDQEDED